MTGKSDVFIIYTNTAFISVVVVYRSNPLRLVMEMASLGPLNKSVSLTILYLNLACDMVLLVNFRFLTATKVMNMIEVSQVSLERKGYVGVVVGVVIASL